MHSVVLTCIERVTSSTLTSCHPERQGKIDHDYLFFKATGRPIHNLQYAHGRWRKTLRRLPGIRYRTPHCARHSSVSWNLMIGRSALWVAQQHGHSIKTMLRLYAAWTQDAVEADLATIERAMIGARCRGPFNRQRERFPLNAALADWAPDWSLEDQRHREASESRNIWRRERGIRKPSKGFLTLHP